MAGPPVARISETSGAFGGEGDKAAHARALKAGFPGFRAQTCDNLGRAPRGPRPMPTFMSAWDMIMDGFSIHDTMPGGAPAASAASATILAAAMVLARARGCGHSTRELRVLRHSSALKMVVDVGLVVGTMPARTRGATLVADGEFACCWCRFMAVSTAATHACKPC